MATTWEFEDKIPEVVRMVENGFEQNLLAAAMEWHAGVLEDMLVGTRSGRTYRIPGSNRTYQASRPGEPPATATGRLRTSYRFRTTTISGELVGEVGSTVDYSLYLEKGTKRMAPRPHLKPAFDSRKQAIFEKLAREISQ